MRSFVGLAIAALFVVSANVKADLWTSEDLVKANGAVVARPNGSAVNGVEGIYDRVGLPAATTLAGWFNHYFGTTFESSNAMLDEMGANPTVDWLVNSGMYWYQAGQTESGLGTVMTLINHESEGVVAVGLPTAGGALGEFDPEKVHQLSVNGDGKFTLDVKRNDVLQWTLSSRPEENADGKVHMLAFDVSEYVNEAFSTLIGVEFESVYMFTWEDWLYDATVNWNATTPNANYGDWDFGDLIVFMGVPKVEDDTPPGTSTPEPATLALMGLG